MKRWIAEKNIHIISLSEFIVKTFKGIPKRTPKRQILTTYTMDSDGHKKLITLHTIKSTTVACESKTPIYPLNTDDTLIVNPITSEIG